jgi:hypothetical protein
VVAAGGVLEQDRHLGLELVKALRQRTRPSSRSPPSVTWPPWTITPAAPTAAAPAQVSASSLRDGMRMRLFGEARLIP